MKSWHKSLVGAWVVWSASFAIRADVKAVVEHKDNEHAKAGFAFTSVPVPARYDVGRRSRFTIVDGNSDDHGGGVEVLNDGKLPGAADEPAANFFFAQGSDGGRLAVDLDSAIEVKQIDTYSWHAGTRGPQVYRVYAADGTGPDFDAAPKRGTDPEQCGWRFLAAVDTRPAQGAVGGQYGVSITDSTGPLGRFRHLLFDMSPVEKDDAFGNTFYSEIDVVAADSGTNATVVHTKGGKYEITVDTQQAPDIRDWAENRLTPVLLEWYPKIVALLPSAGYEAPTRLSVVFQNPGRGVAATGGTRITCAVPWFENNLEGEAIGAVVHELVHVVQQYGRARRANPDSRPGPGWLTEGIADYVRWFLYEPQSHGADRVRNAARAKYDASYRVSANFLNWVTGKYDKDLVRKLNALLREGRYSDESWKEFTGRQVAELGQEWQDGLVAKAPQEPRGPTAVGEARAGTAPVNELTDAEQKADWKLLFNGRDFDGWHSFKHDDVLAGWQIRDGAITCADPHNAGDLCTNDRYGAFELAIDYNISAGGNSGIMYHVTDAAGATWATGPECQLLDNKDGKDPQKSGWLYGLYRTDVDATKPAGEWNHVRLLITPAKCEHELNGVKYFEYVLGSDDFKQRLAHSKFASMSKFASSDSGFVSLQGDHGSISFRNVKIRPIEAKK